MRLDSWKARVAWPRGKLEWFIWSYSKKEWKRKSIVTYGNPIGIFPSNFLAFRLPFLEGMLLFILKLHCPVLIAAKLIWWYSFHCSLSFSSNFNTTRLVSSQSGEETRLRRATTTTTIQYSYRILVRSGLSGMLGNG